MATVCIDCRYINGQPSGIGELEQALVDHLPMLAPDLNFLFLRLQSRSASLSAAANVREILVQQTTNSPATMWWLPKIVDLSHVDLFHSPANILPSGLSMPTLTTIHDVMWLKHPRWCNNSYTSLIDRLFYQHGLKFALRHSSAIATVSDASRLEILSLLPAGSPPVFTTRSGVSDEFRFTPQTGTGGPSEALGFRLATGDPFILTVGQYAPYKNHEGALAAFAQAFPAGHRMQMVFVQRQGRYSSKLLQLAKQLGVSSRVHLLRAVDRPYLIELYSAATALLHPSLCEGFGNSLAEAMACGCPVVTSNISAMPEVAGGAALLANPNDPAALAQALKAIANDSGLAEQMRAAGLARAARLRWSEFAGSNLAIYRKLLPSN